MLKQCLSPVSWTNGSSEEVDEDGNEKTSNNFGSEPYKIIKHLDTQVLAVHALAVEFDCAKKQHLDKKPSRTAVLERLGKYVYAEALFHYLKTLIQR